MSSQNNQNNQQFPQKELDNYKKGDFLFEQIKNAQRDNNPNAIKIFGGALKETTGFDVTNIKQGWLDWFGVNNTAEIDAVKTAERAFSEQKLKDMIVTATREGDEYSLSKLKQLADISYQTSYTEDDSVDFVHKVKEIYDLSKIMQLKYALTDNNIAIAQELKETSKNKYKSEVEKKLISYTDAYLSEYTNPNDKKLPKIEGINGKELKRILEKPSSEWDRDEKAFVEASKENIKTSLYKNLPIQELKTFENAGVNTNGVYDAKVSNILAKSGVKVLRVGQGVAKSTVVPILELFSKGIQTTGGLIARGTFRGVSRLTGIELFDNVANDMIESGREANKTIENILSYAGGEEEAKDDTAYKAGQAVGHIANAVLLSTGVGTASSVSNARTSAEIAQIIGRALATGGSRYATLKFVGSKLADKTAGIIGNALDLPNYDRANLASMFQLGLASGIFKYIDFTGNPTNANIKYETSKKATQVLNEAEQFTRALILQDAVEVETVANQIKPKTNFGNDSIIIAEPLRTDYVIDATTGKRSLNLDTPVVFKETKIQPVTTLTPEQITDTAVANLGRKFMEAVEREATRSDDVTITQNDGKSIVDYNKDSTYASGFELISSLFEGATMDSVSEAVASSNGTINPFHLIENVGTREALAEFYTVLENITGDGNVPVFADRIKQMKNSYLDSTIQALCEAGQFDTELFNSVARGADNYEFATGSNIKPIDRTDIDSFAKYAQEFVKEGMNQISSEGYREAHEKIAEQNQTEAKEFTDKLFGEVRDEVIKYIDDTNNAPHLEKIIPDTSVKNEKGKGDKLIGEGVERIRMLLENRIDSYTGEIVDPFIILKELRGTFSKGASEIKYRQIPTQGTSPAEKLKYKMALKPIGDAYDAILEKTLGKEGAVRYVVELDKRYSDIQNNGEDYLGKFLAARKPDDAYNKIKLNGGVALTKANGILQNNQNVTGETILNAIKSRKPSDSSRALDYLMSGGYDKYLTNPLSALKTILFAESLGNSLKMNTLKHFSETMSRKSLERTSSANILKTQCTPEQLSKLRKIFDAEKRYVEAFAKVPNNVRGNAKVQGQKMFNFNTITFKDFITALGFPIFKYFGLTKQQGSKLTKFIDNKLGNNNDVRFVEVLQELIDIIDPEGFYMATLLSDLMNRRSKLKNNQNNSSIKSESKVDNKGKKSYNIGRSRADVLASANLEKEDKRPRSERVGYY